MLQTGCHIQDAAPSAESLLLFTSVNAGLPSGEMRRCCQIRGEGGLYSVIVRTLDTEMTRHETRAQQQQWGITTMYILNTLTSWQSDPWGVFTPPPSSEVKLHPWHPNN